MGDSITFDDGRVCFLGSSPLSWVLTDVAERVSPELAMWLRDMADRPNGFMSFDLRTMPAGYRREFCDGLQAVFTMRMADPEMRAKLDESRYLGAFRALLTTLKRARRRMPRQSVDEYFCPGSAADQPVVLHDLWSCPNCRGVLEHDPKTSCARCGWKYPFAVATK